MGAVGRREDVSVSIAAQTPTATASWPIAHEEAWQLAGAEALLDLLLEAPDQQHLPQELAEPLLRERRSFSTLATQAQCTFRAVRLVSDGKASTAASRPAGSRPGPFAAQDPAEPAARRRCSHRSSRPSPDSSVSFRVAATARAAAAMAARLFARPAGADRRHDRARVLHGRRCGARPAPRRRRLPASERRPLTDAWDTVWGRCPRTGATFSPSRARLQRLPRARGALAVSVDPRRDGDRLHFVSAAPRSRLRRFAGDGRRCLQRCDAEGIVGAVNILRALSDTRPVSRRALSGTSRDRPLSADPLSWLMIEPGWRASMRRRRGRHRRRGARRHGRRHPQRPRRQPRDLQRASLPGRRARGSTSSTASSRSTSTRPTSTASIPTTNSATFTSAGAGGYGAPVQPESETGPQRAPRPPRRRGGEGGRGARERDHAPRARARKARAQAQGGRARRRRRPRDRRGRAARVRDRLPLRRRSGRASRRRCPGGPRS